MLWVPASGATPENVSAVYDKVEGFIVGSYFKKEGRAEHFVDEARVKTFTDAMQALAPNIP